MLNVSNAASVTATSSLTVGTNGGVGIVTQTGGLIHAIGQAAFGTGGSGNLDISGGALNADAAIFFGTSNAGVPGIGAGTQTGGAVVTAAGFGVGRGAGSVGSYALSGGSLSVGADLSIGSGDGLSFGAFTLSGSGALSAHTINVNPNAVFMQTGGTLDFVTFNQSGGTTTIDGGTNAIALIVPTPANTGGTVNLSGGTLTTGTVIVNAGGVFNQTGGTLGPSAIAINGGGAFNLIGGALTAAVVNQGAFYQGGGVLGGFVTNSASLAFGGGVCNAVISGTGAVNIVGPGIVTFTAANSYSSTTTISGGGVLSVSADNNLGSPTVRVTINNGALLATDTFSTARPITLAGANSTIDVSAGKTLTLSSAFQGGGGLTKGSGAGTLVLAQPTAITLPSLTVIGGSVNFVGGPTRLTHSINNVTISAGGNLDIANHELLTTTSPGTIRNYLASAYDASGNADWSLTGLTSSLARANPGKFSVGYAFGGDESAQDAGVTLQDGTLLPTNRTIVRAVLAGDANLDGSVDFFDITQMLGYKYNTHLSASYTDGDLNYDGVVDFFDLSVILSANYNSGEIYLGSGATAAEPFVGAGTVDEPGVTVPEPGSMVLVGWSAGAWLCRRRRRRLHCGSP
jgi:autotransporter-associated beta strand protein